MAHNWVSTRWRRSARHENLLSMVSATTGGTIQTRVERGQAKEDRVTGAIERQTSHCCPVCFSDRALGLQRSDNIAKLAGAPFVGQWTAPFLIMGNYKTVKQHGSDATANQSRAA
jgi:hypothetical protein